MAEIFPGECADDVWRMAIARINDVKVKSVSSRGGETREVLHALFSISDPRQRWVLSREPPINPAFAIVEVIWIMSGRNDSQFVTSWNKALPRFAGEGPTFHGAYGFRLRQHYGLDQIDQAYNALREDPATRQIVLQVWDPRSDLPLADGSPRNADIPCNICSLVKLRANRLEWCQIIRSNDMNLGFPYNVVQWTSIQEIMAGWLGAEMGEYVQVSDSAHIYTRDGEFTALESQPKYDASQFDDLRLPYAESRMVFEELELRVLQFARDDLTRDSLLGALGTLGYRSYDNLLYVLAAEAARRNRWNDLADTLIHRCENDLLVALWSRWRDRSHHKRS